MYGQDEWGVYANSAEEYWITIDYKIEKMVDHFDIWNEQTENWNSTILKNVLNSKDLFR